MKAVWINGWGLGTGYVERIASRLYPDIDHLFILPKEGWDVELDLQSKDSTVIAYSLGAFLLLSHPDLSEKFERVFFVAPFADIKKEAGKGGGVHLAQLVYLRRWLQRDTIAAVKDFVVRAGLDNRSSDLSGLSDADLIWGIDRLINQSATQDGLSRCEGWIGANDRLLDVEKICELYPNIKCIPGAGHDLGELLEGADFEL